uniref:Solute carrier family 13 member 1 n=1 Tax=Ornithorhynchus anatinus TaxID=9258 RepID=A0A6I8NGQ6_ORNAN
MKLLSYVLVYRRFILILLTPLLFLPLPLILKTKEAECAYTLFVMAIFWLTEAVPLSVTALLPALMFPLFGIMSSQKVSSSYFKDFHILLTGVICLATSIEKWNLHKRIALKMVMMVGVNPVWLSLGFMVSTAFLSMWLSNTSTTAMVMPIVEAVLQQIMRVEAEVDTNQMSYFNGSTNLGLELEESANESGTNDCKEKSMQVTCSDAQQTASKNEQEKDPEPGKKYRTQRDHQMCKLMCLCITYSSTIGGLTTITGTSTNLIFAEHFNGRYPDCQCINFGSWFLLSFPAAILILILSWIWLQWLFMDFKYQEIVTLVLFFAMALLWFTRDPGFIPGWSLLFKEYKGYATDSTVALIVGILFFLIPAKRLTKTTATGEIVAFDYSPLITWKEFQTFMPWDIVILVGGGFALADGFEESGLSKWIGDKLTPLGSLPTWLIILISCLLVTSVTEVASNPATITILMPILAPLAEAIHVNPLYILIPSTLCTSFAFLLPVSNPPNAIVYSYGHVKVNDMVKAGLGVNLIGVVVVMLGITTWAVPMFDLHNFPSWANSTNKAGP